MANNSCTVNQTQPTPNQKDTLRIIFINIGGIREKLYEILDLVQVQKAQIIVINETKLSSKDW